MVQGLPPNVESVDSVIGRHPSLLPYMKVSDPRLEQVGLVITTQPTSHLDVTIYGIFLADRDNVAKNDAGRQHPLDEVVQDYVAHDRPRDTVAYYSGRAGGAWPPNCQHIRNFCQRFGRFDDGRPGQYGCTSDPKSVPLHRYRDASDPGLPQEQNLRSAIANTIAKVRSTPASAS